jgi:hypothetical protein
MNIETRMAELDQQLRRWRIIGPLAVIGIVLLYLAVALSLLQTNVILICSVTGVLICILSSLVRWHSWAVERRVLARVNEKN